MVNSANSISVCVRVRPFTVREAAQLSHSPDGPLFLGDGSLTGAPTPKLSQKGLRSVIKVVDEKCLVFDPPEDNPYQKFSRSFMPQGKRTKDQTFCFDRVFDENTAQADVYEATTKSVLGSVLEGYNATVFAYGATGCGKTHTITGTIQQPGIIFLTMQELFERIQEQSEEKVTEVSLSYLEIYNETIRDLLEPDMSNKQGLMLREDSNAAVSVSGLSSHHPDNVQEVMDMIVRGNENRTISPTAANAVSSRSHAVLQINVSQKDRNAGTEENYNMATLSIIDLAGSERASATKNRGERLLEGANINKSLLALGSCINALCDPRRRSHVPYRDSKLTRLLKFSLGGNCKTVMIVCVSPSSAHFDETQNTLRYANRAKNIQTKVTKNVYNVNRHVKDYLVKIDEQMALINELRAREKESETVAFAKFRKLGEKRDAVVREGTERIRAAYANSSGERSERVGMMKKMRQIERRIAMISSWVNAFSVVFENEKYAEDAQVVGNLSAMHKTAQGMLLELESSRHHYHQRLGRTNWARTIDSALQTGLRQIQEADGLADGSEASNLSREAELMKANGEREALVAVAEQEKGADTATVQILLKAHFETMATIQGLMTMDEGQAMRAARKILTEIVNSCRTVTSHVVKSDTIIPTIENVALSHSSTPKSKKKMTTMSPAKLQGAPVLAAPQLAPNVAGTSPMRGSPRRRMIGAGAARKGVQFTPTKKKSPRKVSKKSLRWRDETGEGSMLADYSKTPQKLSSTPDQMPDSSPLPALPDLHPNLLPRKLTDSLQAEDANSSSPLVPPPTTSIDLDSVKPLKPGSNRFRSGFLAKKTSPTGISNLFSAGSPPPPTASVNLSSDDDTTGLSPLRDIPPSQASNRISSATCLSNLSQILNTTPNSDNSGSDSDGRASDRENRGPGTSTSMASSRARVSTSSAAGNAGTAGLGEEDVKRLKSALKHKRASVGHPHSMHSSTTTGSAPILSSAARAVHRRRSPTGSSVLTGSPPSGTDSAGGSGSANGGLFSASHARRMVRGSMGAAARESLSVLSPKDRGVVSTTKGTSRRGTVGGQSGDGRGSRENSVERERGRGSLGRGTWR